MKPMPPSLTPDTLPFVVLGAQGHAAVVVELIEAIGGMVAGCVAPPGQSTPFGLPLLGEDDWLAGRVGEFRLANGVGSVRDSSVRAKVYRKFRALGFAFPPLVHPSANVSPSAVIAEGAQLMRGALIQARVRIGENTIVNTGAIIDHDCVLEAHVHVAPGAALSGGVKLGAGAHVGTGARLIQNLAIGAGAIIGAGAVVLTNVPEDETVVGVPARKKI